MVYHLLLLKDSPTLDPEARRRLVGAFEHAIREIPTVRRVHLTKRIRVGTNYEGQMPDIADFAIIIEFDDVSGLQMYLQHPAHEELGRRFSGAVDSPLILDFESVGLNSLREPTQAPT